MKEKVRVIISPGTIRSATSRVALPVSSRKTSRSAGQVTGVSVTVTVTVGEQLLLLPLPSDTTMASVKVKGESSREPQLNSTRRTLKVVSLSAQFSSTATSKSATSTEAIPAASSCTTVSRQVTVELSKLQGGATVKVQITTPFGLGPGQV